METPLLPRWIRKIFRNESFWDEVTFFRNVSIFHGLTSRQLARVMLSMQRRIYHSSEKLFEEGQVGKAVFIIKSGKVELSRTSANGPRSLGVLGSGQMFGEMALLEQMQRTATATVVEEGEIFLLYTATLEAVIRDHPHIGVKLLRNMAIMLSALLRKTNRELDSHNKPA